MRVTADEKAYMITQAELRDLLNKKKTDAMYVDGKKSFSFKGSQFGETSKKGKPVILKHEKLEGPFALAIFGGNEFDGFQYRGEITLDEDEYAYVYRDSLAQGYTNAYFCDDNTLLMDVRNRKTREKTAFKIDNEPTGVQSWDWNDPELAGENNCFKELVESTMKMLESKYDHKVYGVIQLDP